MRILPALRIALRVTSNRLTVMVNGQVIPALRTIRNRVLVPVGRRIEPVLAAAGQKILAMLPDGTVPMLRSTRDAMSRFATTTVAPKLRSAGTRVANLVPAGVRQRIPRGHTALVGLLAGAMLLVSVPVTMLATGGNPGQSSAVTAQTGQVPNQTTPGLPGQPSDAPNPSDHAAPNDRARADQDRADRAHADRAAEKAPATPAPPAKPPAPPAKPPAPPAPPVPAGVSTAQVQNAVEIAKVALERGLPPHAVTVALATAFQESNLLNLNYGDRDSLGLFQQRPSMGWGTPAQVMNPHYAAGKFFDGLVRVPNWQNLPVTVAAQMVQLSAFPDAYAKWQPLATSLAQAVIPMAAAAR